MQDRKGFIGGSEIAAVMGMSRWSTPLGVWAEKTGKVQPTDLSGVEAVELGVELEDFVAKRFERKSGLKVKRDNRDFTHDVYPFLRGHIDRWVIGGELLECKTCSAWKAKEWEGEEVPTEYLLQVQWYLGILKMTKAYIAVLIGGQKFVWKEVDFDQELFNKMVETAVNFWNEHVLKDIPPVASCGDEDVLSKMFPSSIEGVRTFEGDLELEVNQLVETRIAANEAIKHASEEKEEATNRLKQLLGELNQGVTGQYRYTWKTVNKKEFVVKATSYRELRHYQNTNKEITK